MLIPSSHPTRPAKPEYCIRYSPDRHLSAKHYLGEPVHSRIVALVSEERHGDQVSRLPE